MLGARKHGGQHQSKFGCMVTAHPLARDQALHFLLDSVGG
jgi:hypothetical protein